MKFDSNISKFDKFIILCRTGIKACRGMIKKLFLKESKGILLVGKKVSIHHGKHIKCGKWVKFEDYSEIQGLCSEGLNFGNYVTIGRGAMIRPSSYYGGDLGAGLTMGDNSSIGPHAYIGCAGKITIGSNVMIGPRCSLFAENHVFNNVEIDIKKQGVVQKGIIIEDNCWIASNVIILDGVKIGAGSVIGAGTVVTKDVMPNSIVIDKRNKVVNYRE